MSEPPSAYLKVTIARAGFDRWLAAKPPVAQQWDDWRTIGMRWRSDGGTTLPEMRDETLAGILDEASKDLARFATNAQALLCFFANLGCDEGLHIAAYDTTDSHFLAGTLTWSENLGEIIACLTLMRGVADYLAPGERGTAVIHNYIWGGDGRDATAAALDIGAAGKSRLLPPDAWPGVVAGFQPVVDAMLDHRLPETYPIRLEPALQRHRIGGTAPTAN
ncbi:hypothetical protein [Sphingomonas sp. CV7422]|uniref:hypothetical protein n=1 Tax=Sphingomonas sp. CV7422 TaxID=3018036 RepID=UPI0022FEF3A1|nr:hypothetical protein [Sphingomonas sp. CV7422]